MSRQTTVMFPNKIPTFPVFTKVSSTKREGNERLNIYFQHTNRNKKRGGYRDKPTTTDFALRRWLSSLSSQLGFRKKGRRWQQIGKKSYRWHAVSREIKQQDFR
jgi:hypothetical protein